MKSIATNLCVLLFAMPQFALADTASNFAESKQIIAKDYSHLNVALGLDGCKNRYVMRINTNKGIAPNWTFHSGSEDSYMNRFMQAVFDSNGDLLDPWSKPISERHVVDGGDGTHWTAKIKENGYRVNGGASAKVLETGPNGWMIRAEPLESIPHYVPKSYYTTERFNGDKPSGFSFAIQHIVFFDTSNTERKTDDDEAISDCVFYYVDK